MCTCDSNRSLPVCSACGPGISSTGIIREIAKTKHLRSHPKVSRIFTRCPADSGADGHLRGRWTSEGHWPLALFPSPQYIPVFDRFEKEAPKEVRMPPGSTRFGEDTNASPHPSLPHLPWRIILWKVYTFQCQVLS